MPRTRKPYPPEFREQLIGSVGAMTALLAQAVLHTDRDTTNLPIVSM